MKWIILFLLICSTCTPKREKNQNWLLWGMFLYYSTPYFCEPKNSIEVEGKSIARIWVEENLNLIRVSIPKPTEHARNLFHLSAAMYDAWSMYKEKAVGWQFQKKISEWGGTLNRDRNAAISFAAYRILTHRYRSKESTVNKEALELSLKRMREKFISLCYNPDFTFPYSDHPASIGNAIANTYIQYGMGDGANEIEDYSDTSGYRAINPPLQTSIGWYDQFIHNNAGSFQNPNRWQELRLDAQITQNQISINEATQKYISPQWNSVSSFSLSRNSSTDLYLDPGKPPEIQFDSNGNELVSQVYIDEIIEVVQLSSKLDPNNSAWINISPRARGNNTLGLNDGTGRSLNPITGSPYPDQFIKEADYGRVIAEYWADGPKSETPPGHWYVIANKVSDDPRMNLQYEGNKKFSNRLEWDCKLYIALGGAVHDAAVVAWGVKRKYVTPRPITSIRRMGALGKLPNIPGLIETISPQSRGQGGALEGLNFYSFEDGQQVMRTWAGEPIDPKTQVGGVRWIKADLWYPYQLKTFVTPAFPGYVSGHSTFSRASAEVLTLFTGSEYFPGGMFTHNVSEKNGLSFENGPTQDVRLEWATYYDAADEAGNSRIWGGIHVRADDLEGRKLGSKIGISAYQKAKQLFNDF